MPNPRAVLPESPTDRLVGDAPAMHTLRTQIRQLARFDAVGSVSVPTVLLHGETGTGKGLVARVLHDSGPRARGPFIDVNCAAIPETMLEAELFGFEAGAFTDAKRAKTGLFEAASGGTLFLDEIDAVSLVVQSKLLKLLEEKRVRRLGAVADRAVDVKLIAATSADLPARVAEGRFRLDLYHRLAVVLLELPPLRARGEDIVALARQFLAQYAMGHRVAPKRLSPTAEGWLARQAWPGNVRELSHLMERVTLLHPADVLDAAALDHFCLPRPPNESVQEVAPSPAVAEGMDEPTRIRQALIRTGGNVVWAAQLLGLRRDALRYRMRRYGIRPPSLADLRTAMPPPADPSDQKDALRVAADGPGGLTSPASPESPSTWEQKPVAVLAIDLTWPEPRAQESRPYEPWTVVARWEQAILEKVQGFGGVVLQRTPSLLLVAFGIPRTLEQMPQRAVHAALALRRFVVDDHSLAGEGPPPVLRLGLHWGPLLVAAPADHGTPPVRVVGETLAVPVRLLGQAPPGQVLASGAMARLVDDWCALEPRAARHDSGLAAGDGAYAIVSARAGGTRLAAPAPRGRRPFVGRAREMAILTECWAHAHAGRGQTVGLAGEPGIGKSRLLAEFIRTGQPAGARLLEIRTAAYTQMMPYQPIIDFLRSYCRIEDRDDGALIQDKVIRQLARLELPQKPLLSPFLALLEGPLDDPTWRAMDPALRREHTREAIRQVLLQESQVQPLLLVVEDLHWGDAETQAVVDRLVDSITGAPLFLLVTYRPEYSPAWGGRISYTSLRLDPLAPADAEALLEEWLGADAALTPFQRRLVERTQGNPFFLEESVQTLIEAGVLVGGPGAYRLAQALTSLQVPATVQAVLAARIDRLPPEATRLLQTAAVMGQEVPIPLLHTLAEVSEDALSRGLAQLQAAEFLDETRLFPDRGYTFRHALTQQVAYETLPQERRRTLHARLVEALEARAGDRPAEPVERLAHHARQGAVWEKAVSYGQQAGEKARNRGAAHEAVTHFEQALDALGHLPESPDTGVLGIKLRLSLGNMLSMAAGEHARSLALLGEAEARARQLDDRARLEGVLSRMVTVRWIVGDFQGALAAGREALALATRLGEPTPHVHAAYHLGQLYTCIGHHRRAAELLRGNVEALTRSTPGDMRWWCIKSQAWLAELLGLLGAFAEGRRHGEAALRWTMEDGPWHADVPIIARARLGGLSLAQGDMDAAIRMFEEGLTLGRTSGYRSPHGAIAGGLGEAYAHTGRVAEGLALLEEARRDDLRTGALGGHYLTHLRQLSAVYRLAGRVDEASQHGYQALDLARQHGARGTEAWALYQIGAVHAQADPPDVTRSEGHYRQALALADDLGMRPLVAHCHHGLGKLYLKVGPLEQARSALSDALALFRSMDMTFWLPQAEASLRQLSE